MKKVLFTVIVLLTAVNLLYADEYGFVPEKSPDEQAALNTKQDKKFVYDRGALYDEIFGESDESGQDVKAKRNDIYSGDPRTLNEKVRSKLHLPPTRKIYYHNIDKSAQPITDDQYYRLSAEKKRADFKIPEPNFESSPDIILPEPQFRVIRYNTPPGQRNIDLSKLVDTNVASSPGILSPDKTKLIYTKSVFYREFSQTASSVFLIPVDKNLTDAYEILYKINELQGDIKPLFSVGADDIVNRRFMTLFPVDWSKDSSKIAFKEKIGSNIDGTWVTNIIIYDFKTKSMKRLTAVREAIVYYWRQKQNINLKDYMWDIFPVGWDKNNPDRLILYAYAFTSDKPLFLGTWSIDFNEEKSKLESVNSTDANIDLNGFGIKEVKLEH